MVFSHKKGPPVNQETSRSSRPSMYAMMKREETSRIAALDADGNEHAIVIVTVFSLDPIPAPAQWIPTRQEYFTPDGASVTKIDDSAYEIISTGLKLQSRAPRPGNEKDIETTEA